MRKVLGGEKVVPLRAGLWRQRRAPQAAPPGVYRRGGGGRGFVDGAAPGARAKGAGPLLELLRRERDLRAACGL